jgi:hypothetical protein
VFSSKFNQGLEQRRCHKRSSATDFAAELTQIDPSTVATASRIVASAHQTSILLQTEQFRGSSDAAQHLQTMAEAC